MKLAEKLISALESSSFDAKRDRLHAEWDRLHAAQKKAEKNSDQHTIEACKKRKAAIDKELDDMSEPSVNEDEQKPSRDQMWKMSSAERSSLYNKLDQKQKVRIENDHSDHKHAGTKAHPLCPRCPSVKPKAEK